MSATAMADLDIPIALRRTRRNSKLAPAAAESGAATAAAKPSSTITITKTPGKKVRFSDIGLEATGLTPMIRRTSLGSNATNTASTGSTTRATAGSTTTASAGTAKRPRHRPVTANRRSNRRHSAPTASLACPSPARRTANSRSGNGRHSSPPPAAAPASRTASAEDDLDRRQQQPLHGVISGRVTRRRNASHPEEETQRRPDKAHEALERELERLRAEVAEKDAEIERLQEATVLVIDPAEDRILELQQEVETLRRRLEERESERAERSESTVEWTTLARDPFAETVDDGRGNIFAGHDDHMDLDIDFDADGSSAFAFGDATAAELICSTPTRGSRRSTQACQASVVDPNSSFPTPPTTSPAAFEPVTPSSHRGPRRHQPLLMATVITTPRSDAGVQAGVQADDAELTSLREEAARMAAALKTYEALVRRLQGTITAADAGRETVSRDSTPEQQIEAALEALVRTLDDRTAALGQLTKDILALGFVPHDDGPGTRDGATQEASAGGSEADAAPQRPVDASAVLEALTMAFRTARLELEYTSPGEHVLPLSAPPAAILDALLTRLRALAAQCAAADAQVDEYHAIELSLRQQLGSRVNAMDALVAEVAALTKRLAEAEEKLGGERTRAERFKGAAEGYEKETKELERLVERLERQAEERKVQGETETQGLRGRLAAAEARLAELENEHGATTATTLADELEVKLADAVEQSAQLSTRLAETEARHKKETASLNRQHGKALALRDARVAELRLEVDRVNGALRRAHETVRVLRVEKGKLEAKLQTAEARVGELETQVVEEKKRAREALADVRAELERVSAAVTTPKRVREEEQTEEQTEGTGTHGADATGRTGPTGRRTMASTPIRARKLASGRTSSHARDSGVADMTLVNSDAAGSSDRSSPVRERSRSRSASLPPSPLAKGAAVVSGGGLDAASKTGKLSGDVAPRRASGEPRKRRRYDSGLGFLDEDEVDVLAV